MDSAAEDRIEPWVWRIAGIVIVGSIMSILDTTIVNVALSRLGVELHTSIANIQWVVTGYLLSLAAVIPISGWAGRRFGAKEVYLTSLVLFTAGSVLCGLATSATELIGFRVLQGIGGGLILPVGQLMMATAAGPRRMGRVMSVVAVPAMLAPILGPALGGLILDNASWRWIFFVNVPIGLVAFVVGLRGLPRSEREDAGPLDVLGLALIVTGMPLITYGLAEIGTTGGFSSAKVIGPIVGGLALVALFVAHARRARRPLLDVRLYARRTFAAASVTTFCLAAALFGAMILMPLYYQQVRGESVLVTGLLIGPQGLGAAIAMPISGRLTDRIGGGPLALFGVMVTTVTTIPFGLIGAHTSIGSLSLWMFLRGLGIGFAFMPAMAAAFAALKPHELSDATPQMNVLQRIGGSIGTAVLAVVLQRSLIAAHHPLTPAGAAGAYSTAFWWSLGITALAIVPSIVLLRAERQTRSRTRAALKDAPTIEPIGA
ncbi:MAG: family efflux transporter permease subunit [Solirubrobacterales bacterium]|jgi:EmrB/QacA subfamily drug resistance transporter|nr:family efflux transporter permease subunit [Solirubrobacterales bacterium]